MAKKVGNSRESEVTKAKGGKSKRGNGKQEKNVTERTNEIKI